MITATRLSRVADLIAAQHDVSNVLQVAVSASRSLLGSDAAFAALPGADGSFAMGMTEGMLGARMSALVLAPGVGLGALVEQQRRAVLVDDYVADPRFAKPPDLLEVVIGEEDLQTVVCVPVLRSDDTTLALLYVAVRDSHRLGGVALRAVETIAGYVALRTRLMAAEARERELTALRERQRLASELHDSVAQALFAIGVEVKRLRADGELPDRVSDSLIDIDRMAGQAGRELRETLHAAARIPDRVALELAVSKLTSRFEEATGCNVVVTYAGALPSLSAPAELLVLDTVREGLCNVAKHASAESVLVHLRAEPEQISVSIHDDGTTVRGDADESRACPGAGIALLRERVRALGGTISFESSDDGGHRLTLVLRRTAGG